MPTSDSTPPPCAAQSVECFPGNERIKGLCLRHYKRFRKLGTTEVTRTCWHLPTNDKFWCYVIKGAEENDCWGWSGFCDKDGYGKMRDGNTNKGAHIISWTIHFGKVPEGVCVLHKCNNPPCSNPAHLKLGGHLANMADRKAADHYPRNEAHPSVKFPDSVAEEIRSSRETLKSLSIRFGISSSQVANIRHGRQRRRA